MVKYTQYTDAFWDLKDNSKYRPYPYYEYRGFPQGDSKVVSIPVDAVSRDRY